MTVLIRGLLPFPKYASLTLYEILEDIQNICLGLTDIRWHLQGTYACRWAQLSRAHGWAGEGCGELETGPAMASPPMRG